jgi:glycosyltransferase involved in cell wall biosynthesis
VPDLRYLLVTHIPFARQGEDVVLDGLWARDLEGLARSLGSFRVAAPEYSSEAEVKSWGPSAAHLRKDCGITFASLPVLRSARDYWGARRLRNVLREEVRNAGIVHTSNYFPPYYSLSSAHDEAVRLGSKTLFVIAEDFHDMLEWEWVRMADGRWQNWRRERLLRKLDARVRKSASTASLTFMHTPAAVSRFRLQTRNGRAIRQPGHEREDVITADALARRSNELEKGRRLRLVTASRQKPLKGLDFLVRAVGLLRSFGVEVEAVLYGHGESAAELKVLAQRLGVADLVTFPGSLPPGQAIYTALSKCDVFLMPHRTTDFGRAFFDAMAAATPVIAFRTAASEDTVRHGVDGLVSPLDDVESLAAAIRRLHEGHALLAEMSRAARERALVNTRSAWFEWRAQWIREL